MELAFDPDIAIGIVALAVAIYGLLAALLARYSVSGAFAFVVIGAVLGGAGLGVMSQADLRSTSLELLAEVTLALVLFSAASTIRLKRLEHDTVAVLRLLALGLPLTIGAGTLVALGLFPGISFGLALLIAAILAPTDADLGHQVVTDTSIPARVRRILNVESGLNDGIVAPIVTIAIALTIAGDLGDMNPVVLALEELIIATVVGILVGYPGRWLLMRADLHGLSTASSRQLTTLALALTAFFLTAGLGGSGFIAAFVAGLAFGTGRKQSVASAVGFTDALSVLLSILVWLVFGLVIVADQLIGAADLTTLVYAVLALTVLRMLPVAIAMVGQRFHVSTILFVGWFGPRGVASIVFALLALDALSTAGESAGPLGSVVALTVVLSVVAHGFSALPLARWYGRYTQRLPSEGAEFEGDEEPFRRPAMFSMSDHRTMKSGEPHA